jgi:prevent-host-death family protein
MPVDALLCSDLECPPLPRARFSAVLDNVTTLEYVMEETVSAANTNRKFSELLRMVREGRSYLVTSHEKPIVRIAPIGKNRCPTHSYKEAAVRASCQNRLEPGRTL